LALAETSIGEGDTGERSREGNQKKGGTRDKAIRSWKKKRATDARNIRKKEGLEC